MADGKKWLRLFGSSKMTDNVPQPPKLLSGGTKALIAVVLVLSYAGLITAGILNYSDSTIFTILLVAMVLVPPVLGYGMMYFLSSHIQVFYDKLDEEDEDEEDEEKNEPDDSKPETKGHTDENNDKP